MVEDRARENAPRMEPRPRIGRVLPHVASRERSSSAGKRAVELRLGAPTGFVSRVTVFFGTGIGAVVRRLFAGEWAGFLLSGFVWWHTPAMTLVASESDRKHSVALENPGTLSKSHPITRPVSYGVALPRPNISDVSRASTKRTPPFLDKPAKLATHAGRTFTPPIKSPPGRPVCVCVWEPPSFPSPGKVVALV